MGRRAAATDIRQIALIADWCAPLLSTARPDACLLAKLRKATSGPAPKTIAEARNIALAAVVLSEAQPDLAEKALTAVFDNFWTGNVLPAASRRPRPRYRTPTPAP